MAGKPKKPVKRASDVSAAVLPNVQEIIDRACESRQYLIAAFRIERDNVVLDWIADNFPSGSVDRSMAMLVEQTQKLKTPQ
jgi:hypothetical protein